MKQNLGELKAVLVDFDGTLVDSIDALFKVYQNFLLRRNKRPTREEFETLVGPSLNEIVNRLKHTHELSDDLLALQQEYATEVETAFTHHLMLKQGAQEFLELMQRKKILVVIVSSASVSLIQNFLKRKHLDSFIFQVVAPQDDLRGKPFADLYLEALRRLTLLPAQTIAIEDSSDGIKAAQGAGLEVLRIGDYPGYHWRDICDLFDPIQIQLIDRPIQLDENLVQAIETAWQAKLRASPKLFNGLFLNKVSQHNQTLQAQFVEYKWWIAAQTDVNLADALQLKPICLIGCMRCQDYLLIGRRSGLVMTYPYLYEVLPSGGFEPTVIQGSSLVIAAQFFKEMFEETGLTQELVEDIRIQKIYVDDSFCADEIFAFLYLAPNALTTSLQSSWEHDELFWLPIKDLKAFLDSKSQADFVPLVWDILNDYFKPS